MNEQCAVKGIAPRNQRRTNQWSRLIGAMTVSPLWTIDDKVVEMPGFGPASVKEDYPGPLIAAVYMIRDDNSALFQLRDEKPDLRHSAVWVPPGGHMDPGETLQQTALREYYEETLLRCETLRWIGALEISLPPWPTYLLGNFWARYDGLQRYECREGQALRFIPRDEAKEFRIPSFVIGVWDRIWSEIQKERSTP